MISDSREPVLQLTALEKTFGNIRALDGVSFAIGGGERVALLGPNGAGKTTLVRTLSGRVAPDAGEVLLFGRPIHAPGGRDALGLVPQEIALYADLTTRENLSAFGRLHGLSGEVLRQAIDWALSWTGLQDRADALVGGFSGGMKRRVNLACGCLHRPAVLLLDEPTVGVDPQSRQRIFSMLDELSSAGTSILLTTHHLDEAQTRSDRIVIIDHGRVVADGSFDELIARSVGSSRMVRLKIDRPLTAPIRIDAPADAVPRGHLKAVLSVAGTVSADPPPRPRARPADRVEGATIGSPGDSVLTTRIDDVSTGLPRLLGELRGAGYEVADVEVHAPSLHHVFLHLTGHELRDE